MNGKDLSYPVVGKLSFFKVLDTLTEQAKGEEVLLAQYANQLLTEIEAVPELVEGTEDLTLIKKHENLISKLMLYLFPPALTLNEIKGATAPFSFDFFYTSQRLKNILTAAGKNFILDMNEFDTDQMYIMCCSTILQGYYHYPVNYMMPIVLEIPEVSGEKRYYRGAFNADLMEINPTEKSIEILEKDYLELIDNFHDIELWKKKFPLNSWEIKGVGLVSLMDITIDQSINMMTSNLLEGGDESLQKVIKNIQSLLRISDLTISFVQSLDETLQSVGKYGEGDILLKDIEELSHLEAFDEFERSMLFRGQRALILPDVGEYLKQSNSLLSKQVGKSQGSYMLIQLEYNNEVLGFLEIGSKKVRELNSVVLEKLSLALPLLSMAASRFKQEELNLIEAIIQEKCTSIHPSVKWKFEKAAREYSEGKMIDEKTEFSDLTFNEVYPLYGQMDIRHSSVLRNEAVKADLSLQLSSVKKVLDKAIELEPLPAYAEMLFRVDNYLNEFKDDLIEGSEQRILSFLKSDIYPIFDYVKQVDEVLLKEVEDYNMLLNGTTNTVYNERKNFDESVAKVNKLLTELLDEKQKVAQKMFPHYFERYKTDGVEYNIYIGESIAEKRKFSPVYLNSLQLWQLESICEMDHALYRLRKDLSKQLEVASLILVHSTPLSINFRMDEKRFDVDGAYNARYEIIKKRVDKALIKGTKERVTQAGKIVIVYTTKEDAAVYLRHIKYIEAKGYVLINTTEDLELEDLQGVTGLKALRIGIDYALAKDQKNLQI